MDLGIEGRVALVHGAGGGLGGAIAAALAAEGARLALADIDGEKLEATLARLAHGDHMALTWDLSDLDAIDGHVSRIEAEMGRVDILVNNTGGPPPTRAEGVDAALWSKSFQSMAASVFAITDRVLPAMRDANWGRVIVSASSGVVAPIPNLAISNAVRLSLVGWAKTLAREVAPDGITVNVLAPGRIATDRIRFLDQAKAEREGRAREEVARESVAAIPAGRYGKPEEYAAAAAFLASEPAAFITGSIMRVDGGMLANI